MKFIVSLLFLLLIIAGSIHFFFTDKTVFRNTNQLPKITVTPPSPCEALHVTNPQPNSIITSPLIIDVIVDNSQKDCYWTVFEAQAGKIELKDANGNLLGNGTLITTENWMQNSPVHYTGKIIFGKPAGVQKATLSITEENPKGDGKVQTVEIPVKLP